MQKVVRTHIIHYITGDKSRKQYFLYSSPFFALFVLYVKEFNHTSTNMIVFASLHKSSTPSKSMPQKKNHDLKDLSVHGGTLVSVRITGILTKNNFFKHENSTKTDLVKK